MERIAIVDWDVHHGNGTQSVFWEEPDVLTISIHQDRLYPPRGGYVAERGGGAGLYTNLNVPLPPGTGDAGYLDAIDAVVVPALRAFQPDLVIVACGFDPSYFDPLARTMVTADGFRTMTERMKEAAAELCGGKLVMVQEGGYSIHYVAICGAITIAELAGVQPIVDPYLPLLADVYGIHEIEEHQLASRKAAEVLVADVPGR